MADATLTNSLTLNPRHDGQLLEELDQRLQLAIFRLKLSLLLLIRRSHKRFSFWKERTSLSIRFGFPIAALPYVPSVLD